MLIGPELIRNISPMIQASNNSRPDMSWKDPPYLTKDAEGNHLVLASKVIRRRVWDFEKKIKIKIAILLDKFVVTARIRWIFCNVCLELCPSCACTKLLNVEWIQLFNYKLISLSPHEYQQTQTNWMILK